MMVRMVGLPTVGFILCGLLKPSSKLLFKTLRLLALFVFTSFFNVRRTKRFLRGKNSLGLDRKRPINRVDFMLHQVLVRYRKMPASKKSIRAIGRRMCSFQDQVFGSINQLLLFLGEFSPQKKYDILFLL